jgi:hypothetical protein
MGPVERDSAAVQDEPFKLALRTALEATKTAPTLTVKVALWAPASTRGEGGTTSARLLLESDTTAPPASAGWVSVTVQLLEDPVTKVVGLQTNEDTVGVGAKASDAVKFEPFRLAVRTAMELVATVPAVALKLAEVAPDGTVTAAGTTRAGLLLDSATLAPAGGAALVRVTVQALVAPEVNVVGLQVTEASAAGADKLNETAWEALPRVAVRTAVASELIVPAVALKLALLDPAKTLTVDGTVRFGLLLESPITVPPVGAAPLKLTVQADVPAVASKVGLQLKELRLGADTVPPVAEIGMDVPSAVLATGFVTTIVVVSETVTVTEPTTPLEIVLRLSPTARQV